MKDDPEVDDSGPDPTPDRDRIRGFTQVRFDPSVCPVDPTAFTEKSEDRQHTRKTRGSGPVPTRSREVGLKKVIPTPPCTSSTYTRLTMLPSGPDKRSLLEEKGKGISSLGVSTGTLYSPPP